MRTQSRTRLIGGAAAILIAISGSALQAQELPRSGDVTFYFTHVNPTPFAPIPLADGRIALPLTFISAAVNEAGSGFMHNVRGRCAALQIVNPSDGTFTVEGYCDWQDPDGDHIYESFWSDGPTPLAGGTTHGRWDGGTGKYEGITGDVTISVFGATTATGGYGQVVGSKTGNYQLR